MNEKLVIVVEDGLVQEVLIDEKYAEQLAPATVLNLDGEAPDSRARELSYKRMSSLPWLIVVDHLSPPEILGT